MSDEEIIKAQTNEIERLNIVLLNMAGAIDMVLNCPTHWTLATIRAELKDMLSNG